MGKKVLQFIGSFHQGGSERQAVQLSKLLKSSGEFEVYIATLEKRGVLLKEVEAAGFDDIREYRLTSFLSLGFVRELYRCSRFLKENRIDIVHTHDFYSNVFGILASRLAGVPIRIASKRETKGVRTDGQEKLERFVYRFSSAITVNANAVGNHLLNWGVEASKIRLIYNGLDLERVEPKLDHLAKICGLLGLPTNKRFVTLVANMRHGVKNQPMLLRCAQKMKDQFPDVHFVFAGEGERKGFLKGLAEKLGVSESVHFIDRCRIVPELLLVSEICVLTSYAEGFSNSILEYMAAGKPVVATDVGGARESVIDGETGFLVESDDDHAMAEKLAQLLESPETAHEFGERGREVVEMKFSTKIQLEKAETLYRSLLETK